MKTLISCAIIALCITAADQAVAQGKMKSTSVKEVSVPENIRIEFIRTNPNTKVKEWKRVEKDGKTMYKAEYEVGDRDHYAIYNPDGTLNKTKREITREEVPQAVWTSLRNSEYANWKVDHDMLEVTSKEHGTQYTIEVENGKMDKKLTYNADGTLAEVRDDH